eukprot:g2411.t1
MRRLHQAQRAIDRRFWRWASTNLSRDWLNAELKRGEKTANVAATSGQKRLILHHSQADTIEAPPPRRVAVIDGSFNPPTICHGRMALAAAAEFGCDHALYVISNSNADKPDVGSTLPARLSMVTAMVEAEICPSGLNASVGATDTPLFVDKAEMLRRHFASSSVDTVHLMVGADTITRILHPKYYSGSLHERDEALRRLFGTTRDSPVEIRLAIVDRPEASNVSGLASATLDDLLEASNELTPFSHRIDRLSNLFADDDEDTSLFHLRDLWLGKSADAGLSSTQARLDFATTGRSVCVYSDVAWIVRDLGLYDALPSENTAIDAQSVAATRSDWRARHRAFHVKRHGGHSDEAMRVERSKVASEDIERVRDCVSRWGAVGKHCDRAVNVREITADDGWTIPFSNPSHLRSLWIENFVSKTFCEELLAAFPSEKFQKHTQGRDTLAFECKELASYIWEKIRRHTDCVPRQFVWLNDDSWFVSGLGSGCRVVRYNEGAGQQWHYDEVVVHDMNRVGGATLMIYLDDETSFSGGRLLVQDSESALAPAVGDAVLVTHDLWHAGERVAGACKHILRVDLELTRKNMWHETVGATAIETYHAARRCKADGEMERGDALLRDAFRECPELESLRRSPRYDPPLAPPSRNFAPVSTPLLSEMMEAEWAGTALGHTTNAGIRLPTFTPLVCASFALKDVGGAGYAHNIDVTDALAGRDPWAICDFLRDSLQWPRDAIFIDSEQTGIYEVDESSTLGESPGPRHWHTVWQWVMQQASFKLVFVSSASLESSNCCREVDEIMRSRCGRLLFVVLDPGAALNEARRLQSIAGPDRAEIYDLSHSADLLRSGLSEVSTRSSMSETLWSLRSALGHEQLDDAGETRNADIRRLWNSGMQDDLGIPLRHPYVQDVRRINVNLISCEEMTRRLPGLECDTRVADLVVRKRQRLEGFRTLGEFVNTVVNARRAVFPEEDPLQTERRARASVPFVTLGDTLALGNGPLDALPERMTKKERLVSYFGRDAKLMGGVPSGGYVRELKRRDARCPGPPSRRTLSTATTVDRRACELRKIIYDPIANEFGWKTRLDLASDVKMNYLGDYADGAVALTGRRGGYAYHPPGGFFRVPLRVVDDGGEWLRRGGPGSWPVGYHGTKSECVSSIASDTVLSPQDLGVEPDLTRSRFGVGAYLSPDSTYALRHTSAVPVRIGDLIYQCVFQCRVRPGVALEGNPTWTTALGRRAFSADHAAHFRGECPEWVFETGRDDNIRVYALLLRCRSVTCGYVPCGYEAREAEWSFLEGMEIGRSHAVCFGCVGPGVIWHMCFCYD